MATTYRPLTLNRWNPAVQRPSSGILPNARPGMTPEQIAVRQQGGTLNSFLPPAGMTSPGMTPEQIAVRRQGGTLNYFGGPSPAAATTPNYIQSEIDATNKALSALGASPTGGTAKQGKSYTRKLPPVPAMSYTYQPDQAHYLTGAYSPFDRAQQATMANNAAMEARRNQLASLGYPPALIDQIIARDQAGGAGGGGGGAANGLSNEFQAAMNADKAENLRRYNNLLQGYQDRYNRGLANLEGQGAQQKRDINKQYDSLAAANQQSLVSRGLGNSTLVNNAATSNLRGRTDAVGRLEDALRAQRLALDAQLSGDILGVIERRNDEGPDLGLLAALQKGIGQAGGGAATASPAALVAPGAAGFRAPIPAWMAAMMMGGGGGGSGGSKGPTLRDQKLAIANNLGIPFNMVDTVIGVLPGLAGSV